MYHLSVKCIGRASGRGAPAAAAYRSGEEIEDERTGLTHDYTRKGGVEYSEIVLPPGAPSWAEDRSALWNGAEAAEKRKDARVAREYEIAIPKDLTREQGIALVRDFSQALCDRYGVAVDFHIHRDRAIAWDGSEKGFQGFHAHVMTTTRRLGPDGFGAKAEPELSDTKRKSLGLSDGAAEIERVRALWEVTANRHLELAGQTERIDRRSLKDQGIEREPTRHMGPAATAMERRGERTDLGEVNRRILAAFEQGQAARRELAGLDRQIIDTQTSLAEALLQRASRKDLWSTGREGSARSVSMKAMLAAPRLGEVRTLSQMRSLHDIPSLSPKEPAGVEAGPVQEPEQERAPAPVVDLVDEGRVQGGTPVAPTSSVAPVQAVPPEPSPAAPPVAPPRSAPVLSSAERARAVAQLVDHMMTEQQRKWDRAADHATARLARRQAALDRAWGTRPAEPTGMLAAFKRKAFDGAIEAWSRSVHHAKRLVEQAMKLNSTLDYGPQTSTRAARQQQVLAKIRAKAPGLVQDVQAYFVGGRSWEERLSGRPQAPKPSSREAQAGPGIEGASKRAPDRLPERPLPKRSSGKGLER